MARQYPIEKYRNIGIIAHIDASLCSLKPCGFNASTTGKLTFSRPLSCVNIRSEKITL